MTMLSGSTGDSHEGTLLMGSLFLERTISVGRISQCGVRVWGCPYSILHPSLSSFTDVRPASSVEGSSWTTALLLCLTLQKVFQRIPYANSHLGLDFQKTWIGTIVCVCVCVHIIHSHLSANTYACVDIHVPTYTHAHTCISIYAHIFKFMCTYVYRCRRTHENILI